jgi:hypothetical protein
MVDLYSQASGETQHWTARLTRTEAVYDDRSRVLFTVAKIDDPYALRTSTAKPIRMGTFVNAVISGREYEDIVVLPRHILRAGGFLWLIDENNKLRNRQVTTLSNEGDLIYVSSGLESGDLVCLTNVGGAVSGTPVQVIRTSSTLDALEPTIEQVGGINPPASDPESDEVHAS